MRFITLVYEHPDGWLQSIGESFDENDGVEPVAQHSSQLLADGTALVLYEIEGDADEVRRILSENEEIEEYQVTKLRERVAAYIHYDPTETVERLLRIPSENGIVVDDPVKVREDGRLEVTTVGPKESLSDAFEQIPDVMSVEVKRVGKYVPDEENRFDRLSDRQREVVRVAYEHGYYEEPRQATHEEIADELDCSKGNVGEILRRVENSLVEEMFDLSADSDASREASLFR